MKRIVIAACLFAVAACGYAAAARASGAEFAGPGPRVTGNIIGGIFPYRPAPPQVYREIATAHCARYGRLAAITSIGRSYGDYVGFVCYDRPGVIH